MLLKVWLSFHHESSNPCLVWFSGRCDTELKVTHRAGTLWQPCEFVPQAFWIQYVAFSLYSLAVWLHVLKFQQYHSSKERPAGLRGLTRTLGSLSHWKPRKVLPLKALIQASATSRAREAGLPLSEAFLHSRGGLVCGIKGNQSLLLKPMETFDSLLFKHQILGFWSI